MFGLKKPVDAAARVRTATEEKKVIDCRLADRTSDLSVAFEGDVRLEFLNLSCGYESWRTEHGGQSVHCLGGGKLA